MKHWPAIKLKIEESHPRLWLPPLVIAGLTTLAGRNPDLVGDLAAVATENQQSAYGTAAEVIAIVAGFTATVMFFFAAVADSPTLAEFRRKWGRQMNGILIEGFFFEVCAAGLMIAALLAAPDRLAGYLFVTGVLLAAWHLLLISLFAYAMLHARYRDQFLTPGRNRKSGQ